MKLLPMLSALPAFASALTTAAAEPLSFTNDIAPIFVQKCLTCHGPEKNKGGYRIDTFESLLKPGSSKEASITAGKPEASALFRRLIATDEEDRMPQKNEPLPATAIARIKEWIAAGAIFDAADVKAPLVTIIPPIQQPDPPAAYARPAPLTALAFSPDGAELAVSGYHEITLWNVRDGILLRRIKNVAQRTLCLAYKPDGTVLAAASGTPGRIGEVKLFDPRTGAMIRALVTSADSMLAVAFSPDGSKLAAGGSDNAIRIFEVATGKTERVIEQHADWVTALAFSHSGAMLASASRDKSARLYNVETGEMEQSYLGHGDFVFGVAFSTDDKRVFSCGRDRKVHIWNTADSKKDKAGEIAGFEGEVFKVIVTSNSVFTCSADHSARQHSAGKTPELLHTFGGHGDVVYAMSLDERTQRLATGTFDGKIRVWSTEKTEPLLTFIAAPGFLSSERDTSSASRLDYQTRQK